MPTPKACNKFISVINLYYENYFVQCDGKKQLRHRVAEYLLHIFLFYFKVMFRNKMLDTCAYLPGLLKKKKNI